jgi:uncharacterized membrane protein
VPFILALTSAALYGAADFLGGFATRRAPVLAVLVLSQVVSIVTVLAAIAAFPPAAPHLADFLWGSAAGLIGGGALLLFYESLAAGTMSVIAPITGVAAIAVPVVVGLATGERPGPLPLVGVALAAISIACVSVTATPSDGGAEPTWRVAVPPRVLAAALMAGVGFGVFYVLIHRASAAAGLWPLFAARATSVVSYAVVAGTRGRSLRAPRQTLPVIAWTGVLDMTANICFLLALQRGLLSIVATLASLYPAATLVLARLVLRERLGPVQGLGLGVATVAIVLISAG